MFNFMKKGAAEKDREKTDREKERRKKEKKLRKENFGLGAGGSVSGSMSSEDLLRLDEVRRSLKIRGRRKEKEKLPSGITADYSAEFFAHLDRGGVEMDRGNEEMEASLNTTIETNEQLKRHKHNQNNQYGMQMDGGSRSILSVTGSPQTANISHSDSSETSLHSIGLNKTKVIPPVPPKPPKRGILKGPRLSITSVQEELLVTQAKPGDTNSCDLLYRNTLQNEIISYENLPHQNRNHHSDEHLNMSNRQLTTNLMVTTSPSPSAESLTDTTNSSFATPPFSMSPVGESQGSYRWSRVQTFEDLSLPLPAIKIIALPPPRTLIIRRQKAPRNDFGFSLRKAMCLDRSESLMAPVLKPVIYAEPGAGSNSIGGNGNKNINSSTSITGLLPGDRLIEVNGTSVENLPREKIIEMIKMCEDSVTVKVQPVAELVELSRRCTVPDLPNGVGEDIEHDNGHNCNTLKRSASKRFKNDITHTDRDVLDDESKEKLWLVHRGGFCAAFKLPSNHQLPYESSSSELQHQSGKINIQLVHNGEQLSVDEEDIEKANSQSLDLVEDLCQLKHLNEASILHCLRQRYASNLIHTRAGPTLIVVNPMAPLSLYSEKVVSMFRGCKTEDMPPHIYSLAQSAYRTLLETRRDQSLIFMGRSGSGKTTSFKHALYYLALAAGSVNKLLTVEKVNAINTILEAFGNTKTCLNTNATRFTQILSLDFDHSGMIASASVQVLLLEKSRAGRRISNDHTFHILSRLLAGAEGQLQKELYLDTISSEDTNPFVSISQKLEDRHKAASEFTRLCQAFTILNIDENCVRVLWCVLASIYHLGHAGVTKVGSGPSTRIQFSNPTAARRAANLLGVSLEDLTSTTFTQTSNVSLSPTHSTNENFEPGWDSLEGLVIGLFSEALAGAVALINKSICTSVHTVASILLVDTPGFQNPASCGQQTGASLSDLKHNYLQERLQLLFYHNTLVAPRNRYAQELVEIDKEGFQENHPGPLVSLIDKAPQNHVVRTSQRDLREQDRRGLLWLLDEEAMYPNSNDDTLLERLFTHYGDREYHSLLRRGAGNRQFILQHLQGTNPVLYSIAGWLKNSREHPATKAATKLLQDSFKEDVNRLFVGSLARGSSQMFYGSIVGLEGTQSLRRVSSIRRSFTSVGVKRNSVMLQVKFIVDGIIDTLRRTGTHFVHCYLLQHNAGTNCIVNGSSQQVTTEDIVNVPLLRSQLRGSHILEAARLHRLGFPECMPISEFARRFGLLAEGPIKESNIEDILIATEIDPSTYRIGPSQVLLRCGVLSQLEAKRDDMLSDRIIQFQSVCRGYLARKRVVQKRVQEMAVRCIQRNVRAFLTVRDWPWWRLLVRVTPLLNVHRTEEQLKIANDELSMLRAKLEKIETDRNTLKIDNDRLEAKLSEMTVDLAEERSTANMATERLESETAERLKLEKDLQGQQEKVRDLQDTTEKLEIELICAKSDINGISEDEDGDNEDSINNGGLYKLKYERAAKELEFTKRRLQTQHEHDLEQLIGLKKQLEKKLADAYEEVEEQRQVVGQWKRKTQKMSNEMNDLRMLLEEQNGRNNLLEKRQRKFDLECQSLQDAARQERQAKDRLCRDKDVLIAEKFTLEQNLADTRLELELKEEKFTALQREMEDISFGGGTEEEMAQLKRSKMDLDRRCKEQEEELDEMAGQVQLLEQAKLRLEMTMETMRKEARREAQQRDEELEETRGSSFKKLKALECQLEAEHEERTLLLREKHELERRLKTMEEQDRSDRASEESLIQKLKRDLRRYKALLKDAQSQLERAKADSPGKALIRQLRNQIEDAEAARTIAMKSRQAAETELAELQVTVEEASRARSEAEEKVLQSQRERTELMSQIEENEEESAELMKKYTTTVKQLNAELLAKSEFEIKISELESEKKSLKDQVDDLHSRLENVESISDPSTTILTKRLEMRTKELESRLELEQATRNRIELQSNRHKDAVDKAQQEIALCRAKEQLAQDNLKKAQKSLRDLREEFHTVSNREQESMAKRKEIEKRLETTEAESVSVKNDLRLALERIADLQYAFGDEASSDSDESYSTDESLSDPDRQRINISSIRAQNELLGASTNGISSDSKLEHRDPPSPRITVSSASGTSLAGSNIRNGDSYA